MINQELLGTDLYFLGIGLKVVMLISHIRYPTYGYQGRAFRGRKFRIFLEKAIIALKHHSRHLLTEDFYIFIFFDIYCQGKY